MASKCDYDGLDLEDFDFDGKAGERLKAEQHALQVSREGKIDEVKELMNNDNYNNIDWGYVMFEAAFSKQSSKIVQKEVLWVLSKRYSGCRKTRQEFCESLLDLGFKDN